MKKPIQSFLVIAAAFLLAGCSQPSPSTPQGRDTLHSEVKAALDQMKQTDSGLQNLIDKSYGYVIFPSIGKGGLIVGGAYGRGEVYEHGNLVGYSDLTQATVGLQAGGQEYSELILFETQEALNKFKSGQFAFGANASAVALKAGASGSAQFRDAILVFTNPKGGLMFEASIGGQKFSYTPAEQLHSTEKTAPERTRTDTGTERTPPEQGSTPRY